MAWRHIKPNFILYLLIMKKLLLLPLVVLFFGGYLHAEWLPYYRECKPVTVDTCNADTQRFDELIKKLEYHRDRVGLSCTYDVFNIKQELKEQIDYLFSAYQSQTTVCELIPLKRTYKRTMQQILNERRYGIWFKE